jgi:hypothetical protein
VLLVVVPVAGLRWWQGAHPPVAESKPAAVAIDQRVPDAILPEAVFPEPLINPQSEPALAPEPTLFDVEDPPLPVLDLNPLMDLFLDGSAPEGLLASATPQPAQNRLVLQVTEAWSNLVPSARTSISEDWQRRSLDLGYSSLQLVDGEEKLLARSARIGSGMIVFDSNPVE